jgi:hypothetical protein
MKYVFFWVYPRRLYAKSLLFGTLWQFHLQKQVDDVCCGVTYWLRSSQRTCDLCRFPPLPPLTINLSGHCVCLSRSLPAVAVDATTSRNYSRSVLPNYCLAIVSLLPKRAMVPGEAFSDTLFGQLLVYICICVYFGCPNGNHVSVIYISEQVITIVLWIC